MHTCTKPKGLLTGERHGHSNSISDRKIGTSEVVAVLGPHPTQVRHHHTQLYAPLFVQLYMQRNALLCTGVYILYNILLYSIV